jgi:GTP-binding protein
MTGLLFFKEQMKFIDEVRITVSSGKGGAGCVSFRREAMVARGGPDGGDGGDGGNVVIRVDSRIHSLLDLHFKKAYQAQDGEQGGRQMCSGKAGQDLVLTLPPGTLIQDDEGRVLHDLVDGDDFIFLKGGIGGKGNVFYKSSVNQAPGIAQKGMPGLQAAIHLELKLLADVGIVGLPNAGKSTLISRISAAKPKIADYPFTTLVPNLGVVRFGDDLSFVVADIPGLIEGAHEGAGLGTQFLRHIERCRIFVHLIDVTEMSGKEPLAAYQEIRHELEMYDKQKAHDEGFQPLAGRPEIVALNKIDAVEELRLRAMRGTFQKMGIEVIEISAATGKNIKPLLDTLGRRVFSEK